MSEGAVRSKEANYLRGFAILVVVLNHVVANVVEIKQLNSLVLLLMPFYTIVQVAVPLFIFISGYVLSIRYRQDLDVLQFYKRRFYLIIIPYLIYSIFYLYWINNWHLPKSSTIISNITYATSYFHMWFFAFLIILYALFPIIIKIYNYCENNKLIIPLLLSAFLWQVFGGVIPVNGNIPGFLYYHARYELFYFILGIYLARNPIKLNIAQKSMILFIFLFIFEMIFWIQKYYKLSFTMPPFLIIDVLFNSCTILMLFELATRMEAIQLIQRPILQFAACSFGIYLIHPFFMYYIKIGLSNLYITPSSPIFYPIYFLLTLLISYSFVKIISLVPYSYLIGGERRYHET
jgi:surface polysaccharide O-acyltransferase-like enzyme